MKEGDLDCTRRVDKGGARVDSKPALQLDLCAGTSCSSIGLEAWFSSLSSVRQRESDSMSESITSAETFPPPGRQMTNASELSFTFPMPRVVPSPTVPDDPLPSNIVDDLSMKFLSALNEICDTKSNSPLPIKDYPIAHAHAKNHLRDFCILIGRRKGEYSSAGRKKQMTIMAGGSCTQADLTKQHLSTWLFSTKVQFCDADLAAVGRVSIMEAADSARLRFRSFASLTDAQFTRLWDEWTKSLKSNWGLLAEPHQQGEAGTSETERYDEHDGQVRDNDNAEYGSDAENVLD